MRLPRIMVAPSGARLTKADHPALPVTVAEVLDTARACHTAGAGGLHLHLRDADQKHLLDAGLYREAVAEVSSALPDMAIQITTEAVGMYTSDFQRHIALTSGASLVSASIKELTTESDPADLADFYTSCAADGIHIQHIIYDPAEVDLLEQTLPSDLFNSADLQLIFVLGRYKTKTGGAPEDLAPFVATLGAKDITPDWAVCAFGPQEIACLTLASEQGGKMRIGFENSIWRPDGSLARDNAERVTDLVAATKDIPVT